MNDTLRQIGNWELIKLFGGLGIILTSITIFVSKVVSNRINRKYQHSFNTKLENVKGEIYRSNSLLSNLVNDHLNTSQKITDIKINSYESMWEAYLQSNKFFPTTFDLIYSIFTDADLKSDGIFDRIYANSKLNTDLIRLGEEFEFSVTMLHFSKLQNSLEKLEPFLSTSIIRYFNSCHFLNMRTTFGFVEGYKKKEIYFWKEDKGTTDFIESILTQKEFSFIIDSQIGSYKRLHNLLRLKITEQFKKDLGIKETITDTVKYIKEIETILTSNKIVN
jgi:hypothetical protein